MHVGLRRDRTEPTPAVDDRDKAHLGDARKRVKSGRHALATTAAGSPSEGRAVEGLKSRLRRTPEDPVTAFIVTTTAAPGRDMTLREEVKLPTCRHST